MTTVSYLLPTNAGAPADRAATLPVRGGLGLKPEHFRTILKPGPTSAFSKYMPRTTWWMVAPSITI